MRVYRTKKAIILTSHKYFLLFFLVVSNLFVCYNFGYFGVVGDKYTAFTITSDFSLDICWLINFLYIDILWLSVSLSLSLNDVYCVTFLLLNVRFLCFILCKGKSTPFWYQYSSANDNESIWELEHL